MATRSLTDVYVLMRNNAFYKHDFFSEAQSADRESLLQGRDSDELEQEAPLWVDKFEDAQFILSKISPKIDELSEKHKRHLLRPMLSEDTEEEEVIERLSHETTQLISQAHKTIDQTRSFLSAVTGKERHLLENVVKSLFKTLQDKTTQYRDCQNSYMKQLANRNKTSSDFFDDLTVAPETSPPNEFSAVIPVKSFDNFLQTDPQPSTSSGAGASVYYNANDDNVDEFFEIPISTRFSQKQLLLFEQDNTAMIEQREKEVLNVMKSVVQLNEIYKELGQMVQEQGTVLDRIDYNVETTYVQVHQGYEQLRRAERHQRASKKMYCILILAALTMFWTIVLLIKILF